MAWVVAELRGVCRPMAPHATTARSHPSAGRCHGAAATLSPDQGETEPAFRGPDRHGIIQESPAVEGDTFEAAPMRHTGEKVGLRMDRARGILGDHGRDQRRVKLRRDRRRRSRGIQVIAQSKAATANPASQVSPTAAL